MKLIGVFFVLLYLASCKSNEVKVYPFKSDEIAEVEGLIKNCKLPNSYKHGFIETFHKPNKDYSKLLKKNKEKIGVNTTVEEINKLEISNPSIFNTYYYTLGVEDCLVCLRRIKFDAYCLKRRQLSGKPLEYVKSYNFQFLNKRHMEIQVNISELNYKP